ncbi:hypothetical protein SAMN04488102_10487 [Alkalibacterium subtropicum]|uniref:DUF308 domain-containing protein n=1 Tax=Alkalibacterium subtropicum TaxID=753702 RepID=A0A1I1HJY6_9LACT|nr:hypothetical protein [Alkalibacterium subtropicum]SFC23892.1 hypothetical protein SAMN04488102_10487 [Alkalibacterium subtropicum]
MTKKKECLTLSEAQTEMRSAFLGGFAGQLVSGLIWLTASWFSVYRSPVHGMIVLFFGSMFIFPLTQLTLRILGRRAKVSDENRLWALGSQIAFIVPIDFLLVGAVILERQLWFFPAVMIIVGAHYLPFMTLYGMKLYGFLGILLILGGVTLALFGPALFSLGGWLTGGLLILFAFIGRFIVIKEEAKSRFDERVGY